MKQIMSVRLSLTLIMNQYEIVILIVLTMHRMPLDHRVSDKRLKLIEHLILEFVINEEL